MDTVGPFVTFNIIHSCWTLVSPPQQRCSWSFTPHLFVLFFTSCPKTVPPSSVTFSILFIHLFTLITLARESSRFPHPHLTLFPLNHLFFFSSGLNSISGPIADSVVRCWRQFFQSPTMHMLRHPHQFPDRKSNVRCVYNVLRPFPTSTKQPNAATTRIYCRMVLDR